MKKVVTVIVLILAIMICGACNSPQEIDDLKSQTAALEQLIATQQGLIDEMQSKLNDNDQNVALMQEKIDELQKQNDLYKAQLRNLTGVPITITADNPEFFQKSNENIVVKFESTPECITPFLDFLEYNKENRPLDDKKVYVFRPKDCEDEGPGLFDGGDIREYYIAEKDGEAMVYEKMYIYDEIFGAGFAQKENETEGKSLCLYLFMKPLDEQTVSEMDREYWNFELKFGEGRYLLDFFQSYNYANIYLDNICIGTCYYDADCYISYTGFRDYLYENLEMM